MTYISLVFLLVLISIIALTEIRDRNKKIEELEKDWRFCKSLLDDARKELAGEQKIKLGEKRHQ